MFGKSWSLPSVYHWDQYARAWEFGISRYLLNSILVTVITVILTVTLSTMAAYALARFRFRGQTLLLFFILGGLMLAPEVSLIPLFRILVRMGIYNTYLALILPYTAFGIPFTTFYCEPTLLVFLESSRKPHRLMGLCLWGSFGM